MDAKEIAFHEGIEEIKKRLGLTYSIMYFIELNDDGIVVKKGLDGRIRDEVRALYNKIYKR